MIVLYLLALFALVFALIGFIYYQDPGHDEPVELVALIPFLGALALFAYGAYVWMRSGEWRSISLIEAAQLLGFGFDDLLSSTGWLGIDRISVWLGSFDCGLVLLALSASIFASNDYWSSRAAEARRSKKVS